MFNGKNLKMVTRSTHNWLMTSLLKVSIIKKKKSIKSPFTVTTIQFFQKKKGPSRRLYSSTVSQNPGSLAGASYHEELPENPLLLLPDPVKSIKETPMMTKSELDKYFYPLFCRGWNIKRLSETDVENFTFRVRKHSFLIFLQK